MKRLAFALLTVSLALTASLWPTGAQTTPACGTQMSVPVVTHGPDTRDPNVVSNVQRVVQNQTLNFAVTGSPGAVFNVFNENDSNLGTGAIPGLATQGLLTSTPNTVTTAESCTDSFWDINFAVRKNCNTIGDRITISIVQSNVSTPLITLVTEAGGLRILQIHDRVALADRGLDYSGLGVGSLIPFSAADGTQTPLITFDITGSLMNCGRLVAEIARGAGIGSTSLIFSDVVLIRNDGDGGTANGQGIKADGTYYSDPGLFGHYPTGLVCAASCPTTCPKPTPTCPTPMPTPTPTPTPTPKPTPTPTPTPTPMTCVQKTLTFTGDTALSGTKGNVRSFTINGVSVKVSAFSRATDGSWSTAYLGLYSSGFGVTDTSEGDGGDGLHRVDNVGRNNYVLFEFSSPLVVDQAFLDSVVDDSDISVWIGTFNNPFSNHLTLSDAVLNSFGLKQDNDTTSTTSRWAVFNGNDVVGNALVIAGSKSDTTPDDRFKISKLNVCK